jgi:hypothetical protein
MPLYCFDMYQRESKLGRPLHCDANVTPSHFQISRPRSRISRRFAGPFAYPYTFLQCVFELAFAPARFPSFLSRLATSSELAFSARTYFPSRRRAKPFRALRILPVTSFSNGWT